MHKSFPRPTVPHAAPTVAPTASESAERHLQHLSHVLAHRLRGLVTSIEGFNDLLFDTLGQREQRELSLRIYESTTSIERILCDLQRFGQPVRPVRQRLQARAALEELIVALDDDDLERLSLEVELPADALLQADPVLLVQALLVLVQNALEAPPRSGIRLVAAGDERAVRFDVWNAGTLPFDDASERVFTPFFTTKAHNLGIGLTIARRIAEAHGGTLLLTENDAERGICFSLELPRPDDETPAPSPN